MGRREGGGGGEIQIWGGKNRDGKGGWAEIKPGALKPDTARSSNGVLEERQMSGNLENVAV